MRSAENKDRKPKRVSRKIRKLQWIRINNLFRLSPPAAANYSFRTISEKDSADGWLSVNFVFFHTTLRRYFQATAITAEYDVLEKLIVTFENELDEKLPYPERIGQTYRHVDDDLVLEVSDDWMEVHNTREAIIEQSLANVAKHPARTRARIDVKQYAMSSYVWFVIDKPIINEDVIEECIAQFRSLGEPIQTGRAWESEEITVIPQNANF